MTTLQATKRADNDKASTLRANGVIPAVIYGSKFPSENVSISREDLLKAWKIVGASSVIDVNFDGKVVNCIIHEIATDPVSDEILHADLLALDMSAKIEVTVGLEFEGESGAVKSGSGTLEKILHEIEIEALPKDLPKSIIVDISSLANVGDHITVGDLKLPAGVIAKTDAGETIATITGAHEEKEEEAAPIDFDAIEVEQKGKKDDTEGEAPAEETKE